MHESRFSHRTYFLGGVVLATIAFGVVSFGIVYRIGPARVWAALGVGSARTLDIPADILEELRSAGAVVENAPASVPPAGHDTILVQPAPDPVLEYRLRPNVRLDVTILPSNGRLDLDPPTLVIPSGARISDKARAYLRDSGRMHVSYTTDADAHRVTLPTMSPAIAENRILIVGDSVAFGVGVNDKDTVASELQQIVEPDAQVVNAAVGGYDGQQAARTADILSRGTHYSTLVYVACQNDFMSAGAEDWMSEAKRVLAMLRAVSGRFGRVVVVLETLLDYEGRDVLLGQGWPADSIARTDRLKQQLPGEVAAAGFVYADWSEIVGDYRQASGSILAPFSLYVDHVHLSPAGNRLMAERIAVLVRASN